MKLSPALPDPRLVAISAVAEAALGMEVPVLVVPVVVKSTSPTFVSHSTKNSPKVN